MKLTINDLNENTHPFLKIQMEKIADMVSRLREYIIKQQVGTNFELRMGDPFLEEELWVDDKHIGTFRLGWNKNNDQLTVTYSFYPNNSIELDRTPILELGRSNVSN